MWGHNIRIALDVTGPRAATRLRLRPGGEACSHTSARGSRCYLPGFARDGTSRSRTQRCASNWRCTSGGSSATCRGGAPGPGSRGASGSARATGGGSSPTSSGAGSAPRMRQRAARDASTSASPSRPERSGGRRSVSSIRPTNVPRMAPGAAVSPPFRSAPSPDSNLERWCPQGDSNPRFHLERVASSAARRWGRGFTPRRRNRLLAYRPARGASPPPPGQATGGRLAVHPVACS